MPALAMPTSIAWRVLGLPAASRMAAAPQVPGYRLQREIGTGRRTSAWLAIDLASHAEVVLKLQPAPGPALRHEWDMAGQLRGPQLVRLLAHGATPAWAWLAMEHVPGGDLAGHLRASLAPAAAVGLLRQAAQALAALHRAGFVHRDVKPANFLLRADASLVLGDFGLLARTGQAARGAAGGVTGTPRYVAPEQLQGAAAAPAADVYSLGVLLHEMLCGQPPFGGVTLMEVLAQQLVAVAPRLPAPAAALQPLVDRMLAKEVQRRLPDADAVLGLIGQGGECESE